MTDTWTDGNSIGGALRDVFSVDMTGATGRCAGAETPARSPRAAPSAIPRDWSCAAQPAGEALLRLARAPGRAWLDIRGLEYIELVVPE